MPDRKDDMNAIEEEQARQRAAYKAQLDWQRETSNRIHAESMDTYYTELSAKKVAKKVAEERERVEVAALRCAEKTERAKVAALRCAEKRNLAEKRHADMIQRAEKRLADMVKRAALPRNDRATRLTLALAAILPQVKLVPTRLLTSSESSWKIPSVVLRDEPDVGRSYRNRVSLAVARLIHSYELRNSEYAMLLTEIRKALAPKITP